MKTIIRLRNVLLAAAVIAVLVSLPISARLEFDQRLESFFADDHPDIAILHRSRDDFGGDEFVIVAWKENRLLRHDRPDEPDFDTLIDDRDYRPDLTEDVKPRMMALADRLNQIPGVAADQTQHLAEFLERAPSMRATRRAMMKLFEGTLIGPDARTTAIVLTLLPQDEAPVSRRETLDRIREAAREFDAQSAVAGEPVQVHDMFQLVEEDAQVLFLASLVMLAAVLLALFRGIRWTLGAIGLVLGTVICTRAILVISGSELSMVGSMLNSLVTVIGIATCMHVVVHYRDLRHESERPGAEPLSQQEAAAATLNEMAAPVFWTCLTTAVGFGSLLVSQITPVRSFSIMMCLAILVLIAGCATVLPALLGSGHRLKAPRTAPLEHWLDRGLSTVCRLLERHPKKTGCAFLLTLCLAVPGVYRLTIETDFSRNFRDSSSIVQSLQFIENNLGEAGTWEVAFDTPAELTDEFFDDITELTEKLNAIAERDGTMSVLSLADLANLPPRFQGPQKMLAKMTARYPHLIRAMYNEDAQRMRIVLRSREQQPAEVRARQIAEVRAIAREFHEKQAARRESTADDPHATTASGMFILMTEIIRSLLQDQLRSFLLATTGILVCMTIAFRSLRIGLISLFPNIFPVALLLGSLGWIGVPVNIGTAMIASVSMGLTVDSTIHYIFAFERARKTMSVPEALQAAHAGAGRAVVFAHLALVAGFAVLAASRFIPLVYFGALMSLSMIFGVFGDLLLLPLLLRWTTPVSCDAVEAIAE